MRRLLLLGAAGAALGLLTLVSLVFWPIRPASQDINLTGDIGRGAYLARMSGCIACHTDAENGGAPLAGGLALKTDFGTFYSPNLTTDADVGIGSWSVSDFAIAVRNGVSPDGKPYYPAFPYPFYRSFSDQDVADLWAAFQTVPPVATPSKPQDLKLPFTFRSGLKIWRAAFLEDKGFTPTEGKSDLWNRGKFIVEGPAHCAACHTPRNFAGARQAELDLHGAGGLPGGEDAPPIFKGELIENGWTHATLKYALRTGVSPSGDVLGGSMGEVIRDGTSFLSDEDLTAISTFLLDEED
jgi:mono/diheme cytochrome c family protein